MLQRISGLVLSCYLYLPVTTTFLSAQNFIIPITRKYMTCRYRKRCYIDVLLSKTCCSLYVNRVSYMHMDWRLVCIFDWWRASPLRMMYIRLIGNLGRSRVLWNLNWLHMIKHYINLQKYDLMMIVLISFLCTKYNERNIWI